MGNISSTMTIGLVDNVSKPARTVAQALKDAERAAEQVAKGMANTGASDRFAASLSKLKLGAKDIQTVSQAMRDYAKSSNMAADASQWTKADIANIRNWERDKISALRAVKREQVAFNRSLASGGVRGGGAPGGGAKGTRAHGEGGGWSVYVRTCNRAGCIQLRRAERRAVGDRRRRRPGNHRRRLVHRQRAADIID